MFCTSISTREEIEWNDWSDVNSEPAADIILRYGAHIINLIQILINRDGKEGDKYIDQKYKIDY